MARGSSDFAVPVADLLSRPGAHRSVVLTGLIEAGTDFASTVKGEPVMASLEFEALIDGILVTGSADVAVRLTCNRCLLEWDEVETVGIMQLFGREPDEDGYGIEHDMIHLDGPLRDEIILAMPLVPLCDQGCRGLCAICGADLNTAPCSGHEDRQVSPFADLKDLLTPDE